MANPLNDLRNQLGLSISKGETSKKMLEILNHIHGEENRNFLFVYVYGAMKGFASRRGLQERDCENIAMETMAKILANFQQCETKKMENPNYSLRGWIYEICRNNLNDFFRKGKRTEISIGDSLDAHTCNDSMERQLRVEVLDETVDVYEALEQLTEEQQYLVKQHYLAEWTRKEIGEELGQSQQNIGGKMGRALKKLNELVTLIRNARANGKHSG